MFLLARVLRGVVYESLEPTPEMFDLSEPLESERDEPAIDDEPPPPDRRPNLIGFRANMARAGFPTYFESAPESATDAGL
jgi:hypothetical protein